MPRTLHFNIPEPDTAEFSALPDKVRLHVERLLVAMEKIAAEKKRNPKIRAIADQWSGERGMTFETIRRKWYHFSKTGNWRALLDRTALPKSCRNNTADQGLPGDFTEYLKGLFQSNGRKSEPAIRLLYRQWSEGRSIPGYGTWLEWFQRKNPGTPLPSACPDKPHGWSKSNLRRQIPEPAELALVRQGIAAALQNLPDILTTRKGLRPLEVIVLDDFRTDFKILVPNQASPVELNGLVALDVATGRPLRYGLRPAIEREDGTRDHLKLRDVKTLLAGVLLEFGLPRNYTMHLIVENAVATVRDAFAAALSELGKSATGGKGGIEVHKTEMICGTGIWCGYREKSTGNPQGKAHLESTFNLLWNEAAFLPGQTGRRYDVTPAELEGRTKEAAALVNASKHLTPIDRARLKMPFPNYSQARVAMTELWNLLAARSDHEMEAFEVICEWRVSEREPWRPDSELANAFPSGAPKGILWRNPPRKESPMERWARLVDQAGGEGAFVKPHPGSVARLFEERKRCIVRDYEIFFRLDKEDHYYRIAKLQNGCQRAEQMLRNGAAVFCAFDPQDRSWIHCYAEDGGYLGSIPRTLGIRRTDKEALQTAWKEKREHLHRLQDVVSSRLPEQAEARIADLDQNIEILSGALVKAQAIDTTAEQSGCGSIPSYARLLDSSGSEQLGLREDEAGTRTPGAQSSPSDSTLALLKDIRSVFRQSNVEKMFTAELLRLLIELPNRPWAQANHGGPIDAIWLSRQLRGVDIHPRALRIGDASAKSQQARGYSAQEFARLWRGIDHGRWASSSARKPVRTAIATPIQQG